MKHCLNCETELKGIYQLKFCSHKCAAIFNNKKRCVIRNCKKCGDEIKGKNRIYCSNKCQTKLIYEEGKKLVLSDNADLLMAKNKNPFIKRVLIEKYGNRCMECGWCKVNVYTKKVPIELEHIDGHSDNNKLKNLKLLCPSCHSLTKTYKGANVGNGRKNRYKNVLVA